MSVTIAQVQTAIASLPIEGVKAIFTSANVPVDVYNRALPVLMPDPSRPVESSANERLTVGGAAWVRQRTFNYVCLVAELGSGRKPGSSQGSLSTVMDAVENAFCDFAMAGIHKVTGVVIRDVGIVQDATSAGVNPQQARQFHGFTVTLTVLMTY